MSLIRTFTVTYKSVKPMFGTQARAALLKGVSQIATAVTTSLGPGVLLNQGRAEIPS